MRVDQTLVTHEGRYRGNVRFYSPFSYAEELESFTKNWKVNGNFINESKNEIEPSDVFNELIKNLGGILPPVSHSEFQRMCFAESMNGTVPYMMVMAFLNSCFFNDSIFSEFNFLIDTKLLKDTALQNGEATNIINYIENVAKRPSPQHFLLYGLIQLGALSRDEITANELLEIIVNKANLLDATYDYLNQYSSEVGAICDDQDSYNNHMSEIGTLMTYSKLFFGLAGFAAYFESNNNGLKNEFIKMTETYFPDLAEIFEQEDVSRESLFSIIEDNMLETVANNNLIRETRNRLSENPSMKQFLSATLPPDELEDSLAKIFLYSGILKNNNIKKLI